MEACFRSNQGRPVSAWKFSGVFHVRRPVAVAWSGVSNIISYGKCCQACSSGFSMPSNVQLWA